MDELNQFLNSVESSARRIIKQQNKKQHEQLIRDRAALTRAAKNGGTVAAAPSTSSPVKSISRDELKATYSPGGALIVQAPPTPSSPLKSPSRRSEHESDGASQGTVLPRLPQTTGYDGVKSTVSVPPYLPSIDRPKHSKDTSQATVDAIEAAKKAQREKRTSDKIMNSPLHKSLVKSRSEPQGFAGAASAGSSLQSVKKTLHEVDNVNLLLKKLGMRDNSSPTRRPDHAVERRMCNACWASPNKLTGCEHHARVLPSNNNAMNGLSDEAQMLRQMELQGPTSWLSDDLFVKYRSEADREKLWHAFCRLKEAQDERERQGDLADVPVIPIVVRHPIVAKFYTQIELENLKTQAETRRRNQSKTFIFDVNHIWLTNLDHFNTRLIRTQRRQQRKIARLQSRVNGSNASAEHEDDDDSDSDELDDAELQSLRDRRDETAIREGYCQIQSISTARALENAVFPSIDTIGRAGQPSSSSSVPVTPASPTGKRRRRPRAPPFKEPPLTLLVCGAWNPRDPPESSSLERVPGVAIVGSQRVLWWRYPHDDPSSDYTKAVAILARSKTLSSSNAILVALVLALDTPVTTPMWFAWHVGSKAPPPQQYELPSASLLPPQHVSHCLASLLSMKLQTRIDALLPGTIMLISSVPHADDLVLELEEPYGHRRFWPEHDPRDAFRQWWRIDKHGVVAPNYEVDPQFVSVQIAQPNATGAGGRFTWHAIDAIARHLNRPRKEKDYVYIIENHATCGSNGAVWFIVAMAHEVMKDVAAAKLADFLQRLENERRQKEYEEKLMEIEKKIEIGRLQLDAKRQEQKRIQDELAAKAAVAADRFNTDKMSEATLMEWEHRLRNSVVVDEQVGWQRREITEDQSHIVFYYALNDAMPRAHRFAWEKPVIWPEETDDGTDDGTAVTSRSDASSASSRGSSEDDDEDDDDGLSEEQRKAQEAITQMATALLADEQFLKVLKAKLGLDTDHHARRQSTKRPGNGEDDNIESDAERVDLKDHMIMVTEEQDRSKASLMATKMAKLSLSGKALVAAKPGEGWKRLKVSRLPRSFARTVYSTHTEGPRSSFINRPNHPTPVGMIDPRESSPYEPPEFIPELRVLLVPKPALDLQEKKMQWAEYMATHPADGVEASAIGSASASSPTRPSAKDALFEKDPAERDQTMEQLVAKAVLCARNNNLQGLEDALDGGCEVNARDNHGNSLFVLVCQQGNKKMAKFLMRRHADMNLQNLNGNTALHYLIAYKHTELAEYIKAKGAVDTIQNAAGLTCYEGLSMEQAEAI